MKSIVMDGWVVGEKAVQGLQTCYFVFPIAQCTTPLLVLILEKLKTEHQIPLTTINITYCSNAMGIRIMDLSGIQVEGMCLVFRYICYSSHDPDGLVKFQELVTFSHVPRIR